MALQPPSPTLGTQQITVAGRVLVDDTSGGQSFSAGASTTYPYCIATMQIVNHQGMVNRAGTTLGEALWDVLIFNDTDPGIVPQKSKLTIVGQDRILTATLKSTKREAGCWYVLAKSID